MQPIHCVCIGAGAAGRQVMHSFLAVPDFHCTLLIDRSASPLAGIPFLDTLPARLPACDLLLLAVQDRELAGLAALCAGRLPNAAPGIVAHLSAATPLSVLEPLYDKGWRPAMIHPLQSLPKGAALGIPITWWGLCAEAAVAERLQPLLEAAGGRVVRLRPDQQLPWHISAAWVANLLPALLVNALEPWPEAERGQMREVLLPIMEQALRLQINASPGDPAVAGPLRRGDGNTLRKHLDWLAEHGSPRARLSYRLLSASLLEHLETLGEHPLEADPELRARLLALPPADDRL